MGIFPVLRPLSLKAQYRDKFSVDTNCNRNSAKLFTPACMAGRGAIPATSRANKDLPSRLSLYVFTISRKSRMFPALVCVPVIAKGGNRDKLSPCNWKTGHGLLFFICPAAPA